MTCPITADRDEFRGAVTEREAALVEALEAAVEYMRFCTPKPFCLDECEKTLARAHTADAGGE